MGITQSHSPEQRCDRCDLLLIHSKHEGKNLAYARGANRSSLICVQCATHTRKVTINDLDDYLTKQITKWISPKAKEKKRGSLEYDNYIF